MYDDLRPWLIGVHVLPLSSLRNDPADEMAVMIRSLLVGSRMIVCRHRPPAPGAHVGAVLWVRRPDSSSHDVPPLVDLKSAASSTPAKTVSGSVSDGSRCQTRKNS